MHMYACIIVLLCHIIYIICLPQSNVDFISGHANFVSEKCVEVNGQIYSAEHILIATGGVPSTPAIEGKPSALSTTQ